MYIDLNIIEENFSKRNYGDNRMKNQKLLTFEIVESKDEIEIHLNKEGINELLKQLNTLSTFDSNDHLHLFSESWGGSELTEQKQAEDNKIVYKVTIYYWKDT